MSTSKRVLRFGGYTFGPDTLELRLRGEAVPLPPTASRVLAALLSRRGGLATRAELRAAAWPGAPDAANQSLNTCIKQIRAALGDDARAPRFIATVHRRGYRMILAVDSQVDSQPGGRRRSLDGCPAGVRALLRPPAAAAGGFGVSALAPWARRLGFAAALGAAFLAGQRSITTTAQPGSAPPRVHFDVSGASIALEGIGDRLTAAVGKHLTAVEVRSQAGSRNAGVLITGVVSPAPDGAELRARIVRLSDGATLWTGTFNPLCPDAPSDPVDIIGRYLARTVSDVHRI